MLLDHIWDSLEPIIASEFFNNLFKVVNSSFSFSSPAQVAFLLILIGKIVIPFESVLPILSSKTLISFFKLIEAHSKSVKKFLISFVNSSLDLTNSCGLYAFFFILVKFVNVDVE